jgi:adenosine deaminase
LSRSAVSSTSAPVRSLRALPKAHLHLHFEAAVRRPVLADALRGAGTLPPVRPGSGFDGFAEAYLAMIDLLAAPGMFALAFEAAARDAQEEGVVYLELAVSPHFYASAYGSAESALLAMIEAARAATEQSGVQIGLMLTIDRTLPVAAAEEVVALAIAHADRGVVSIGAANDERGYPLAPFAAAISTATAAGLAFAPHAGELVGPDAVREALELGARRIEHGIRAVDDPSVVAQLAAQGVCLDVCPTSNVLLGVVPSFDVHPLPALLRAGVPCTINADDPTILEVGILDEYTLAREQLGLDDEELAACARTSIQFSALDATAKAHAFDAIDAWLTTPGGSV